MVTEYKSDSRSKPCETAWSPHKSEEEDWQVGSLSKVLAVHM